MDSDYVIIKKDKLPQCYNEVLKAKDLINSEGMSVSDACKAVNISRSTFYKYSNDIYTSLNSLGRKAKIMLKALNFKGILSNVLNIIAQHESNVLTINQDLPIQNIAYISIMIEIDKINISLPELISEIKAIKEIKTIDILAIE